MATSDGVNNHSLLAESFAMMLSTSFAKADSQSKTSVEASSMSPMFLEHFASHSDPLRVSKMCIEYIDIRMTCIVNYI